MTDTVQIGPLSVDRNAVAALCRRRHIRKLSLFGSALRKDATVESDVDVLVDFEPGHTPGFFAFHDIEEEISALFKGRPIHLATPRSIDSYQREQVKRHAEVLFAAR